MSEGDASGIAALRRGGRSTLLRAGLVSAPARSPLARSARYALLAIVSVLVGFALLAIGGAFLGPLGPARPVYPMNDEVWLQLRGRFWTAIFPESLLWLAVVIGPVTLALVEFLGVASPVRRSQLFALRLMIHHLPNLLISWQTFLRRFGMRQGLAEALLRELRDEALAEFTEIGIPDPNGLKYVRLALLQQLQICMGIRTTSDLIAIVDVLGLAQSHVDNGQPSIASGRISGRIAAGADGISARAKASSHWNHRSNRASQRAATKRKNAAERLLGEALFLDPPSVPEWIRVVDEPPWSVGIRDTLEAIPRMSYPASSPETLACMTVGVALSILADGGSERMAWFDAWSQRRATGDVVTRSRLAAAESLCAFEFWAAKAEERSRSIASSEIFAQAFPDLDSVRERGEEFAVTGHFWRVASMKKPSVLHALRRRAAALRRKGRPSRMARIGMRNRLDPALAAVVTLAFCGFALFGWLLERI